MTIIRESKDYDKFELLKFNRNVVKTKALESSMQKYGFLDPYPIHVTQSDKNGKFLIKSGHHRFYVARKLGISIKYVVSNDTISIYELEKATVKWTMNDYLVSMSRDGNRQYEIVQKYCEDSGIPISCAISMLCGNMASTNNFSDRFKSGTYEVKNPSHALSVKDIVMFMKTLGLSFANTDICVKAISKVLFVKEFNASHFKTKLKKFHHLFARQGSLDSYLQAIEDVYNHTSKSKIPLKFLSEEAARKRNVVLKDS